MDYSVLPRSRFLKISMILSLTIGLWPQIFDSLNKRAMRSNNIRFHFISGWFIFFHSTQYLKLVEMFLTNIFISDEIRNILYIIPLYLTAILKARVIRGNVCTNLLRQIVDEEQKAFDNGDEEVLKIFKRHINISKAASLVFLSGGTVSVFFYVFAAYFKVPVTVNLPNNITIQKRLLTAAAYVPFDDQKYFWPAFLWNGSNAIFAGYYIMFSDILIFNIIIFSINQMKVLQHILRHFGDYSRQNQMIYQCGERMASRITQEECILKHRKIIRYLDDFNMSLSNIMLFEFLQCSLQFAFIILEILAQPDLLQYIFVGQYISTLIGRLFIYYRSGQEVITQSVNISWAIYNCSWMDQPVDVQKNFVLMIMRAQRQLKISVGPFFYMSLETYVNILKASYSYMMAYTSLT